MTPKVSFALERWRNAGYRTWRDLSQKISIYWAARAPLVFSALPIVEGDLLLDLGCNTGLWSRTFAHRGAHVVGMDLDAAAVEVASQFWQDDAPWSVYTNGSVEELPFKSDSFHAILCLDVLDIVPNDRQAAEEMLRVLRPGGRLVITVMSRNRRRYFVRLSFAEHVRNYALAELRDLLVGAGFDIRVERTFYRRLGGLARESGALVHYSGLGRVPGLNVAITLVLAALTRVDVLIPADEKDGGIQIVAEKLNRVC